MNKPISAPVTRTAILFLLSIIFSISPDITISYGDEPASFTSASGVIYYRLPLEGTTTSQTPIYDSVRQQPHNTSTALLTVGRGTKILISAKRGGEYEGMVTLPNGNKVRALVPVAAVNAVAILPQVSAYKPPASSYIEPQNRSFLDSIPNAVWVFPLFFIMIAGIIYITPRRDTVYPNSSYPTGFSDVLQKRFPKNHVYFVPNWVPPYVHILPQDPVPQFCEDYQILWKQCLDMYPTPPLNEVERQQREDGFWDRYADFFTVKNSNEFSALKPKQDILDYFIYWEKWVFRDYYAATGVVKKTIIEDYVRVLYEHRCAYEMKSTGDPTQVLDAQRRSQIEKTTDAEKRFRSERIPAHMDQWGSWFFHHIQDAFDKKHVRQSDYGPLIPLEKPSQPVQDDITYKPNA